MDLSLVEAKYRDFARSVNQFIGKKEVVKVSDKSGIIGFWVPSETWERLIQATKALSDNLSDKMVEIEDLPTCDKCGSGQETRTIWHEGEEKRVCFNCVVLVFGKNANAQWKKLL